MCILYTHRTPSITCFYNATYYRPKERMCFNRQLDTDLLARLFMAIWSQTPRLMYTIHPPFSDYHSLTNGYRVNVHNSSGKSADSVLEQPYTYFIFKSLAIAASKEPFPPANGRIHGYQETHSRQAYQVGICSETFRPSIVHALVPSLILIFSASNQPFRTKRFLSLKQKNDKRGLETQESAKVNVQK